MFRCQGRHAPGAIDSAVFLDRATPGADGSFRVELPVVEPGTLVSATATDAEGNTSELSRNLEAVREVAVD